MNVDTAFDNFKKLYDEIQLNKGSIQSEHDARFHVIDRILVDVLGWTHIEVSNEVYARPGFADYVLQHNERNVLVIEAKRQSHQLIDTKNPEVNAYKAGGPALESARDGLLQAQQYCARMGVSYAALTSGFQWIAFWAIREGKAPDDGKAIVFPSLEAILGKFARFYDLFSKEGVTSRLYQAVINEEEGIVPVATEKLRCINDWTSPSLLPRSKLASDLEKVFREFFSSMAGDNDPEMLIKCFVESKESKAAESSLQKITRNLINQVELVGSDKGEELQEHIKGSLETQRGEFVLIIGNKGAGKSTFVDRFFKLTLEKELRDKCLIVRLDLADAASDERLVTQWLQRLLREKLENAIFGEAGPTYEELEGAFFSEYQRWQRGEHKFLYETDKNAFKIKFGEYIESIKTNSPDLYIERLLQDTVRNRKLMPCIVFDNTDHFSQRFQETVFQFAQSVYRKVFSFIVCPITDRTIWQLSKSGPIQSYESTAFYLPIPSTKEVLEKRVQFIKEKIGEQKNDERGEYFLSKGIRLTIGHIKAFASCVEEIFVHTEYLARLISWLANHDIRRSLSITQRIITSPTVSIEELIKAYIAGQVPEFSQPRLLRAVLFGDYNTFNQSSSDYILNVFSVHAESLSSPLTKLSILRLLTDIESGAKSTEDSYITVEAIQDYFEPTSTSRRAVQKHIEELLRYRLIEPYDPTSVSLSESLRVKITSCGKIHYELATQQEDYVIQVGQTTEVRPSLGIDAIRSQLRQQGKRSRDDWKTIASKLANVFLDEDKAMFHAPNLDSYDGQRQLRQRFGLRWTFQPQHGNSGASLGQAHAARS
jgi:energy-coupling factor transporter ATP-binding protein EcfA2